MNKASGKILNNSSGFKWVSLIVVVTMSFMACLDASVVNIALPVISTKLIVSMSKIQWIVTAYIFSICLSILIFGRMGDIYGKTKVFKIGIVGFTLGSLACALSVSYEMLLVSRIIQGVGAAAYMANNQGIITENFSKEERGRALGFLATGVAIGTMLGAPIGGFILTLFKWNIIFFINVPIGCVAFITGLKFIRENHHEGALIKDKSIKSYVSIFSNKTFSLSLLCAMISYACISASIILVPFYLQYTRRLSTNMSGLIMMISPLIIAVFSPISGSLVNKFSPNTLSLIGLSVMNIGFLLMSTLSTNSPIYILIIYLSMIAIGQVLFQPTNNYIIMSSVTINKLGIAGSFNSLTRNLGQAIGIVLSTEILFLFMSEKLGISVKDYVVGRDDIFVFGLSRVYFIIFFICLFGVFISSLRLLKVVLIEKMDLKLKF